MAACWQEDTRVFVLAAHTSFLLQEYRTDDTWHFHPQQLIQSILPFFSSLMSCDIRSVRPLPIISCQRISSVYQSRIWQSYPGIMAFARKHSRDAVDGDEGNGCGVLESLSRPISPPRKKFRQIGVQTSPWQLTRIRDLPETANRDTVSLQDLLGDPLIRECWQFNFLHDIPFIVNAFDESVKHLVQLHVIHGFWKRSDLNRILLSVGHLSLGCGQDIHIHCPLRYYLFPLPPLSSLQRMYP